jgi:hypothetical protein
MFTKTVLLSAIGFAAASAQNFMGREMQTATYGTANNTAAPLSASAYTATLSACTMGTTEACTTAGYCCGAFYNITAAQQSLANAPASTVAYTSASTGSCAPAEFNASSW